MKVSHEEGQEVEFLDNLPFSRRSSWRSHRTAFLRSDGFFIARMSQQRAGAKNRAWFRISGSRARGPSTPAWFRSLASRAGFYRAQDPAPRVLPYSDVHGRYHSSFLSLHVPSLHVSDGCSAFTSVSWSVFLPNARWNSILYHVNVTHSFRNHCRYPFWCSRATSTGSSCHRGKQTGPMQHITIASK